MNDAVVSTAPFCGEATLENVVNGMTRSFKVVMGWQKIDLPHRYLIGSGDLRNIIIRVRNQPVNFMITVHQSLETARDGQNLCRQGLTASRILLGEQPHDEGAKPRFIKKTVDKIKKFASDLKQSTKAIYNRFRLLRTVLLDIHQDLDHTASKKARSVFLVRLARHLSKDIKTCEDVLQRVHDDLAEIEKSLNQITHWWQKVESEANYLRMNGDSSLAKENNAITIGEIKDCFSKLEGYFEGYITKMDALYDENMVQLNRGNMEYLLKVQDNPDLVLPYMGLLGPAVRS